MNSGHSLSQGLRIQLGVNQVCSVGCATVVLPRLWFKPACEQNGAQIEPSDGLSLWLQLQAGLDWLEVVPNSHIWLVNGISFIVGARGQDRQNWAFQKGCTNIKNVFKH